MGRCSVAELFPLVAEAGAAGSPLLLSLIFELFRGLCVLPLALPVVSILMEDALSREFLLKAACTSQTTPRLEVFDLRRPQQ